MRLFNRYCKCPVRFQRNKNESALVALQMILAYHNAFVPIETLRDNCCVERDGINDEGLIKIGDFYGLTGNAYCNISSNDLLNYQIPSVIKFNNGDYVTFTGMKGNKYCFNHPKKGELFYEKKEFVENFSGNLYTFAPNKDFKTFGHDRSVANAIFHFSMQDFGGLVILFLICLLLVPPTVITPNLNKIFLDNILNDEKVYWAIPMISIVVILFFSTLVTSFFHNFELTKMNLRLSSKSSMAYIMKMFQLPSVFFASRSLGDLSERLSENNQVAKFITDTLVPRFIEIVIMFIFAGLLFYFDSFLATITVLAVVVNIALSIVYDYTSKNLAVGDQAFKSSASSSTIVGISMIESMKSTSTCADFVRLFISNLNEISMSRDNNTISSSYYTCIRRAIVFFTKNCITLFAVLKLLNGDISGGVFIVFQVLLNGIFQPVEGINDLIMNLAQTGNSIGRIEEILDYEVPAQKENSICLSERLTGKIEFKNITFGYNKLQEPLIKNFNLTINPGERIAIIGSSGSGKSTIIKLLSGILKPWSGEVCFDGRPITDYSNEYLRYSFASVDQDIVLFEKGTIMDNIALYDSALSLEEIEKAAKDAAIHKVIVNRPGGYLSEMGCNDGGFSGGEKQRLEIARALAVNPSILLLDEATSALDTLTETEVDNNIRKRGITTVIVAHRLSTIRDADKIIVLHKGEIREVGKHEELLALKGIYYSLVSSGKEGGEEDHD